MNTLRKNVPVREITDEILVVLSTMPSMDFDKVKEKVQKGLGLDPRKSMYYHYTQLLEEELVQNEGRTKPLILSLTMAGREQAERIKAGRTRVVSREPRVSVPRFEMPTPARTLEIREFKPTKLEELSRLHMGVAVLLEQIAKLERAA